MMPLSIISLDLSHPSTLLDMASEEALQFQVLHIASMEKLAIYVVGRSDHEFSSTTSNIISRGGYSAFVGAVRPAAPTQGSLQIMRL